MPPGREPVQLCPPRSFFRFGVRSQEGEALLLFGLELGECRREGLEDVRLERVRVDELRSAHGDRESVSPVMSALSRERLART
jgi:hypothetical protein